MTRWYYENGGRSVGPMEEAVLRGWVSSGALTAGHLVRPESGTEWQRADIAFPEDVPRDREPDFLADICFPYFDAEGFCFAPVFDVADGRWRVSLFYQNRFSNPCRAEVAFRPASDFLGRCATKGPLRFRVACAGGEFGIVRQTFGLNRRWQGTQATFFVQGKARYADSTGVALRLKKGLDAQRPSTGSSLLLALLTLGHLMVYDTPAKIAVNLPAGVAEGVIELQPEAQTLWVPGQPVVDRV